MITRVVSPDHQILHYNVTVALEARPLGHRFSRRDDLLFMNHKRRRLAPLLRPRPFALPQSTLLPARLLIQLTGLESRSLLLSLEHRNLLLQLRNLLPLLRTFCTNCSMSSSNPNTKGVRTSSGMSGI